MLTIKYAFLKAPFGKGLSKLFLDETNSHFFIVYMRTELKIKTKEGVFIQNLY